MARLLMLQNYEYEVLGPMYISAVLRDHGHDTLLKLGQSLDDFRPAIESFQPHLVGFSVISGNHLWALDMARASKREYGISNLFGGPHATFFPEFIKEQGVDALVRGEGEDAALDIMERVDRGRDFRDIPNVIAKVAGRIEGTDLRDLRDDLDDYPFPDRTLYQDLEGRTDRSLRTAITSRGCPFNCSFCFEITLRKMYKGKGKYVRIRRIDKIIEELRQLQSETDVRTVFFCDDLFGMDKEWLYEFLPVYKREIGLPFTCQVRADIVASEEKYARALREGLCLNVSMGVESGNEDLRNRLINKKLTNAEIIRAADYLHRAGIPFRTYNILGLPGETLEDAFSTVDLNVRIKTDYPWCALFSPLPRTQMTQYAMDEGYLDPSFHYNSLAPSYFTASPLRLEHKQEIENMQKFFQTACAFPSLFPLIKFLIRLPPNILFKAWFCLVYFYFTLNIYNLRLKPTLRFATRHVRRMLAF